MEFATHCHILSEGAKPLVLLVIPTAVPSLDILYQLQEGRKLETKQIVLVFTESIHTHV